MARIEISDRKKKHIEVVLDADVEPNPCVFNKYKLPYKALPEIALDEVNVSTTLLGKKLGLPFIISSMTGGEEKGKLINRNLALAAEKAQVALALGSMRIITEKPNALNTFNVRKLCTSIPLFANLGLVQLNYGFDAKKINSLIDAIAADGIFLHINPLQEAIQPEGNTNFKALLLKLKVMLPKIKKPVFIKEVGNGLDSTTIKKLAELGVKYFDVAGLGGTSWPKVEYLRRNDNMGEAFQYEGIPTDIAISSAKKVKNIQIIAGGGIRNGVDIAKALILGADYATAAKPILECAIKSAASTKTLLKNWEQELRIACFITGSKSIAELKSKELLKV